MSRRLWLPAFLLCVLAPPVAAQNYVTAAAYRVPFERVDSLRKLLKETKPLLAEAKRLGGIVDDVWLIHAWGGEYNVVEMTTWKSWAAIEDTTLGLGAAGRRCLLTLRLGSESTTASRGVQGVSHIDNIYQRVE